MSAWIIKGRPSINDLSQMLVRGRQERWVTRKPPKTWAVGDLAFMWKGAPALCVLGLSEIVDIRSPDEDGDSFFTLRYVTDPLPNPLGISSLRADPILSDASFLKAGAAGTLFGLSSIQANRLADLVRQANGSLASHHADGPQSISIQVESEKSTIPEMALSIRQPWAELIMSGIKTIEVRSTATHKRERVHVYASQTRAHPEAEEMVRLRYHLDVGALPRGVLVGTVEIVDCRPVAPSDSTGAAFTIHRGDSSFGWHLANPTRAKSLQTPTRHPQPMFFRPF